MILRQSGKIAENLFSLGEPNLPAWLLVSESPALFDSGITFMGPQYLNDLKKYLGDEQRLKFNFLTHSHFDHSGASPYLKRHIPGLKVGASRLAAETYKKEKAIDLIRSLSRDYEQKFHCMFDGHDVSFDRLEVETILEDGQEFDLGSGYSFKVISTPGHTRDSVSFYIPKLKALIPGEAIGVVDMNNNIHPEFLSSYQDYVASLEKMTSLDLELILMSHYYILTDSDASGFLRKTLQKTHHFRNRIERYLNESGGEQAAVIKKIFKEDFLDTGAIRQDERSYLINLGAKVKAVAEKK